MDLTFRRGDQRRPVGHALVYFRNRSDGAIVATYVVVPPIKIELSRYMPPMLQAQLPSAGLADVSAVPLPPVPEPVADVEYLERLAAQRHDDLVDAGTLDVARLDELLARCNDASQSYLRLYDAASPAIETGPAELPIGDFENEMVVWDILSNRDRLGELAKLIGAARYAISGDDAATLAEVRARMTRLGSLLPASFRMEALIDASCRARADGDRLSRLYLDRCYKLLDEDYRALEAIDLDIHETEQA